MHRSVRFALAAFVLAAGGTASCDHPAPLDPAAAPSSIPGPRADLDPITGNLTPPAQILDCPVEEEQSTTGTIGPEGGTLAAGGFRIDFPAGAVASPQAFVVDVPAGRYLELDAHAVGYEHFWFAVPVTVTLDVSRCGLLPPGLQAWNIDSATKTLLEPMGGVVDSLSGTIQFHTPHFSGYTIAW